MVEHIDRDELRTKIDGETLSSSLKCWPLGTTGTLICPER